MRSSSPPSPGDLRKRRIARLLRSRPLEIPGWPRHPVIRLARRYLLRWGVFAVVRSGYSLRVRGRGHLTQLDEACIIISNHNMHLDQAVILKSFPPRFRERVAIAAAAQDIYTNRFRGFFASLLGNAFPFNKEGSGVRQSLATVAHMLDDGWNVLIFPEGKLTVIGPMQPFKSGTGYLAVETGAPVLPLRIDVVRPGLREGRWFPNPRAKVEVHIGRPVRFPEGTSYAEATSALERAVLEA